MEAKADDLPNSLRPQFGQCGQWRQPRSMAGIVQVADIELALYLNDSFFSSDGQHRAQKRLSSIKNAAIQLLNSLTCQPIIQRSGEGR